ncbi:N-acetylated-alpha-linked acidic dipeptidase 2 [Bulinus truncatus]|nr:N-acetylated-alpha-linked acidic dipeptidase 2 [Bulinus truncatus]
MRKIDLDQSISDIQFGRKYFSSRHVVILLMVAGICLATGLLVGRLAMCSQQGMPTVYISSGPKLTIEMEEGQSIDQLIMTSIDPRRIEENLRILSSKPHIAGRKNDFELVALIQRHFRDHGLRVQTTPYDVLLSYPSETTRNSVRLVDVAGEVLYDSVSDESDTSHLQDVVQQFHGYAASGLVKGDVVYAGYGRHVQYETLLSVGVNVTGKIVLVKYGKIFRGSKVAIAESRGAVGVVIFSDPIDSTGMGRGDPRVYPDAWWLPPKGVQRGSVFVGEGDPLTPGYPSNNLAYRWNASHADPPLPKIPSHPVGYGAAYNILRHMRGLPAPSNWTGGLNITYRLGPDRYILMGNHRDAWIYGALDPSSGTAVILEISRVFGKSGQICKEEFLDFLGQWKPRRSIIFCSWGAEEYGLIGSTEWVEQYVATLRERVIGYININCAVTGNDTLRVLSTPLFQNIVYEASQKVSNLNPSEVQAGRKTVYDTWLNVTPNVDDFSGKSHSQEQGVTNYAPILQYAGITAIEVRYTFNTRAYDILTQPLYHTEYETFEAVKQHFDRDFQFHAAVARVAGEMTRTLTDSVIIPFNISNYARRLEVFRQIFHVQHGLQLKHIVDNYDLLVDVIQNFTQDVTDFETHDTDSG